MTDYSFLKALTVIDIGRTRAPKTVNPKGLTLRIFKDGKVYPSKELVDMFNLEFKNEQEEQAGNGFDIVDTQYWTPLKDHPRMVMVGVTPKQAGKVDLFASVRYHEDSTPKSSVLNRGEVSDNLLTLVKDLGWLTSEQKYVDLKIVTEHPFTTTDGIAYIPKVIEKGGRKGEKDYKRRDNITFYPVEMIEVGAIPVTARKEEKQELAEIEDNLPF